MLQLLLLGCIFFPLLAAAAAGLDKDGLPLGLQLIGRAFDEETLLRAAAALEKAAAFSGRATGY